MSHKPEPVVPFDVADRILAECVLRGQAYDELGWLCDHVGGRISGAESGRQAEEWAFRLFKEWGLENVRYEEFPQTAWTRGPIEVGVLEPTEWKMTALAHGNAPEKVDATAEVIDVLHGERCDYERLGEAVKGKFALCDEGVAEGHRALHRSEKLLMAAEAGALGLMISSSASGALPRTGVCFHGRSPIASIGISQEDGERLRRLLPHGAVKAFIKMRNTFTEGVARNVLADIAGSEKPGEVVLAGGHLDSWDVSQGATDNGLGSAIVLEMARTLKALGRKPKRTLRFALWAAEEVGLCGSHDYAHKHAGELDDLNAVLNFDMTGDPFGYWCPGRKEQSELLKGLAAQLAGVGMKSDYAHQAGLHSDHQPFMLEGVPAFGLMARLEGEGGHYYHSVGDTFEKVSRAGLARAAVVGATTMWAIADASARAFPRFDKEQVMEMVREADLVEALAAEGWGKEA